jgi:predicted glycosyltransferase involved in capsule biosynthesis
MSNTGLSIVFPVMNRTGILVQSVPSWLDNDIVDEIIIVDWSSSTPIYEDPTTQHIISNDKVRVIRVNNEKFFLTPSLSINLGVVRSSYNNILKLDIDYKLINNDFLIKIKKMLPILKTSFFVTDYDYCKNNPENICLTGFTFFNKLHFFSVNGYNENLNGWGYEDLDFYDRMSHISHKYIISDLDKYILHIPHSNELRMVNHQDKHLKISDTEKMNRYRAKTFEQKKFLQYKTLDIIDQNGKPKYEILERYKNVLQNS